MTDIQVKLNQRTRQSLIPGYTTTNALNGKAHIDLIAAFNLNRIDAGKAASKLQPQGRANTAGLTKQVSANSNFSIREFSKKKAKELRRLRSQY